LHGPRPTFLGNIPVTEWKLCDYQESGFNAIVGDSIPHHARLSDGDGVLKLDHLAAVQSGVGVHRSETALAVVQQAADDFLARRIVEEQFELAAAMVAALGASICGRGHD
jgi:hypothetical protein